MYLHLFISITKLELDLAHSHYNNPNETTSSSNVVEEEAMEVDAAQESTSSGKYRFGMEQSDSPWQLPKLQESQCKIDDQNTIDRPFNLNERFVTALDQLDTRVERVRKEALELQEKRDFLLMSVDLIKNNELLHSMDEYEREEIHCYIHRVNSRLSTVELNVRTVRDKAQEDSLHQVNVLIDSLITNSDPVLSRQRCQTFLNACSGGSESSHHESTSHQSGNDPIIDKKFESALLGCTLDDQKNIKKRLQALMNYLNKQTISD